MSDEELLRLNRKGFIPGPEETESEFLVRVNETGKSITQLGGTPIPIFHWDWVRGHLKEVFDFEPESLPAFYSNRLLAPWQGAAAWILDGKLVGIQLREKLKSGSYLGLYRREEILAHEAVHAARSAFQEKANEEFFAYLTSEAKWRRAIGPIIRSPWEVWPLLSACLLGVFWESGFLLGALWVAMGLVRLTRQHMFLKKAAAHIQMTVKDPRKTRAVLLRLTDAEIRLFSKMGTVQSYVDKQTSLRWRLIRLAYFMG
jgi:hypothetical protein